MNNNTMKSHLHLRKFYQPLQPLLEAGIPIEYQEIIPSKILQPYIYCYWTLKSRIDCQSIIHYRIVSDGCLDLFINCSDFEPITISGMANKAQVVSFPNKTSYFGIRFYPGCLQYFFNLPIKELTNKMMPLHDIWHRNLGDLDNRLFEANSTFQRIQIAENFLLKQLANQQKTPDDRFLAALVQILIGKGAMQIENGVSLGLSPRQLRRYFDLYIGLSPKTYSRIIRFQSILHQMKSQPKEIWGKLCYDFGYYDQAHFIHEFKQLSGLNPSTVTFS